MELLKQNTDILNFNKLYEILKQNQYSNYVLLG